MNLANYMYFLNICIITFSFNIFSDNSLIPKNLERDGSRVKIFLGRDIFFSDKLTFIDISKNIFFQKNESSI